MQTVLETNCNIDRKDILNYFFEGLRSIKLLNDLMFYTNQKQLLSYFLRTINVMLGIFLYSKVPTIRHIFGFVAENSLSISRKRLFQNTISI